MNPKNNEIIYCATALIDLLGISSHIEVSNDFRTRIGKEVIKRLNNLDNTLNLIANEKRKAKKFFPNKLFYTRINDTLIFSIDLPEFLTPSIGEIIKDGMTGNEIEERFFKEKTPTKEEFYSKYNDLKCTSVESLSKFVGLVSSTAYRLKFRV